jgi:LexA DNA binding domain
MSQKKPDISEKPLTKAHKRALDQILESVQSFLMTAEGQETMDRLESIMKGIHERHMRKMPVLSPTEAVALQFIVDEQRRGRFPSVREVAKAIGFRSSRSGHRVMQNLADKGVIEIKGKTML